MSTNGSTFNDLTGVGVNLAAYTIPVGQIPAGSTYYYQRGAKSTCEGSFVLTSSIPVAVAATFSAGTLSPLSAICTGTSPGVISGSAPSGGSSFTYSWQTSTDGTNWSTNIGAATSATYDPPENISVTTYYRRTVSSSCGSGSSFISVAVYSTAAGTITIGSTTVCFNGGGTFGITGNSGSVTWQKCTAGCSPTDDTGWTTNSGGS